MRVVLRVSNLTKIHGRGCPECLSLTGPEHETNLCKRCGSVVACANVSFELYEGEILGILGESGSGKSTVIKLLNFEMEPTFGDAYLYDVRGAEWANGKNLFSLNSYQKRMLKNTVISVVYQNPLLGLNANVSAAGNVAERLLVSGWRNYSFINTRVESLLEKMEFPIQRMKDLPKSLSGGMQQRVQIAKALANEPSILLLDEPTTGLDLSVQARVLDLIRKLHQELNLSMIFVSHDLRVINLLADRVIVMKLGRIVEMGLTDQILNDPQHEYTQLLVSSQL